MDFDGSEGACVVLAAPCRNVEPLEGQPGPDAVTGRRCSPSKYMYALQARATSSSKVLAC